jgi:hypothetical protein
MMNVANDMCPRFGYYVSTLNGAVHFSVHNNPIGGDCSSDLGLARHKEGSAAQLTFDLTIDLHQTLSSHPAKNP